MVQIGWQVSPGEMQLFPHASSDVPLPLGGTFAFMWLFYADGFMQGSRDGVIRHLLDEYPHIAGLEPFVRPIPTRLKTTFRLELLGEGAAREAIQRPAKDTGVDFTDAAAQKSVDNLLARSEKRRGVTWGAEGYGETTVEFQIVERDGYLYLDS